MSSIEKLSEIKSAFPTLSLDNRVKFLSALALELTISMRSAYPTLAEEKVSLLKLIGLNEVQHTVTGQLTKILAKDDARYPDDVFFDILFEKAKGGFCDEDLFTAVRFVFEHVGQR
jgi:hypothetical protein